MTRATYALLENYMLTCMDDSAHDREHVYRVLYHGLEIARTQETVDYDVLIAACLAGERRQAAVNFYHCLFQESASAYRQGRDALAEFLTDS